MTSLKITVFAVLFKFLILLCPRLAMSQSTIDEFAWLAGRWHGDGLGGQSEEIWAPPSGGTMMGMFRHTKEGKVTFYEFFIIKEDADGFKLKLKHFTPELVGWEEQDKYVTFPLLHLSPTRIEFDGLVMEKIDTDKMNITVQIKQKDGETIKEVFRFARIETSSP